MEIYYHGSDQRDLAIIKPNISTHGKKYIYATKYRNIALLFLGRWNDFLLSLETTIIDNKLKITLVERYKDARGYYEHILSLLKKMSKIKGGRKAASDLVEDFRLHYKNRRAMMEVLSEFNCCHSKKVFVIDKNLLSRFSVFRHKNSF